MSSRIQNVFACLSAHDVRYVVIGGVAAILHGVPRTTLDHDLLIEASLPNAERLLKALLEAGLGTAALITPQALLENEITVFKDVLRIDVQTRTPGLTFEESWQRRETRSYGDTSFFIVCKDDLIRSKRAAGRAKDLEDVRILERAAD